MTMRHLGETIRKNSRALRSAQGGNVTLTFALVLVPIVGLVGAAVDYSRADAARSALQAALDSTALMLSKEAPTMNTADIPKKAGDYFKAVYNKPGAPDIQLTTSYNASSSSLVLSGAGSVDTTFSRVIGHKQMGIGASTTVKWGMTKLRVALALDNTGSMASDNKMGALKTATKQMLGILQKAATNPGDVQVAIIPFSRVVNVGKSNYNANWIDWEDWDDDNGHDQSTTTCTTQKTGKNGKKKKKCSTTTTWVPDNHNTWNGCVADRDMDHDVKNTTPTSATPATLFPAEQYAGCPVALMGLGYNWAAMNTLVDQMQPDGMTNQTIGLAWAWQALSQGEPLNAPAITDPKTQQVIILLTDGLNTENRFTADEAAIDARTKKACDNIKAAGIQIYTVLVMSGNSSILQQCASKSDMYFALSSAGQMVTTFNQIGTNLAKLRIAK
jgi:Flp pilus assembly protein TadG